MDIRIIELTLLCFCEEKVQYGKWEDRNACSKPRVRKLFCGEDKQMVMNERSINHDKKNERSAYGSTYRCDPLLN